MLKISCSAGLLTRKSRLVVLQFHNLCVKADRARSSAIATPFHNQNAIDVAAAKQSVRLTPTSLLYAGKAQNGSHLLRSAQFLHKELPVRIAHRIAAFQNLPYVVGSYPIIYQVHTMYRNAFDLLNEFRQVKTMDEEKNYTELLRNLLETHRDVIELLAEGFSESRKHLRSEDEIRIFLDRTLTSRLGIRLLCEHHIALRDEKPNHVGMFNVKFSPRSLVEKRAEFVRELCEDKYGAAPKFQVQGSSVTFPYISQPLDYILIELLKNAYRATIESHIDSFDNLPPVVITIVNNDIDFIIRISDKGGGIPHNICKKIWDYNFTTAGTIQDDRVDRGLFGEIVNPGNRSGAIPTRMHGYGFGLPGSRAFAEYLGGSISMETMQGLGTEVYLRLPHITGPHESFRI